MNFDTFVGAAYEAAASLQDVQKSINYFVEIDNNSGAKTPTALLATPGLIDLGQTVATGEARGMWVLPGSQAAIVVVGSAVLLMTPVSVVAGIRPTFTYRQVGTLLTTTGLVGIRDNGVGHICVIVDGPTLYVYNVQTEAFTISTDAAFLGATQVCEIDGFFIFAKPDSQIFYTSPVYWNGTSPFDGTYFALKDNAPDNIVCMIENSRELWLIGEKTTEVWYMQGGNFFPLGRLQGTMQQLGCAAEHSLARIGGSLLWLGLSDRGGNQVLMSKGYSIENVSDPAMAYQINQYATVSDARAFLYVEEGHTFYVITFPSANTTWALDLTTKMWHNRASYDPVRGQFNRQYQNVCMNFQNMNIVGDRSTGAISWQTRTAYDEVVSPLVSVRQAPHMWDRENRNRMLYTRLQLELKPGSAPSSGTYSDPKATLSWSDDGGQSFSNDHIAPIGLTGQTKNRIIWRRLGIARDRVFKVTISDPVNRDIVGASVTGTIYKS